MIVTLFLGLAMAAAVPEPVEWTAMADPDPHFVEPRKARAERKPVGPSRHPDRSDLDPTRFDPSRVGRRPGDVMREFQRVIREVEAQSRRHRQSLGRPERPSGTKSKRAPSPEFDAVRRDYEEQSRRLDEMAANATRAAQEAEGHLPPQR